MGKISKMTDEELKFEYMKMRREIKILESALKDISPADSETYLVVDMEIDDGLGYLHDLAFEIVDRLYNLKG